MFDTATLKVIRKIDVGKGPDGIYYDPGSKRVFTNNHGSHDITAIDAVSGEVVGTVKLEGDGEEAVIAGDGNIFVNSEDTAEVVGFDPRTLQVTKRFPIGVAKTPTGLAYDAKNKRLFIACRTEPKMVVMDAVSGKVIADFPIATGADWAEFDAASGSIFVSTAPGTMNVFHQKSANEYEAAGEVATQTGSRTMAFDRKTKKIFLPSVEYDVAAAPAQPGRQPRRTIKPGTFAVIVLEP
jgi:DNA-binding beta-propeller fold protein YncE